METRPLDDIEELEEMYASEIPADRGPSYSWDSPERPKLPAPASFLRKQRNARRQAELVQRIICVDEAAVNVQVCDATPERRSDNDLLLETNEHAMGELFAAEALNEAETARSDSSSDPIDCGSSVAAAENNATKDHSPDSQAKRPEGSQVRQADPLRPAWLYPEEQASEQPRSRPILQATGDVPESLERSKERIAARWFALRSVFARDDTQCETERVAPEIRSPQAPILAVFSIAGGAGKTSLVATLGRALSSVGERVLLSDAREHGLLPFYFGARQLGSSVVRTFSPPAGGADAPIHLLSYDAATDSEEAAGQAGIIDALLENSVRANRILLDLGVNCSRLVRGLGEFNPTILVPLLPDLNSVISIDGVEKLFGSMSDGDGRPLQPVYLLNQFDASLPLHLDIREVLKQQLGERLLPFVVRGSAAVGEALAEGMTIVDYDPGSAVAGDYLRVAKWLRSVSAPVALGFRDQRWREQQ